MPPFSRYTAKLSFLYFTCAFALEASRWSASLWPKFPLWPWHRPIVHLFFVGGVMQIIFSVAFWMLPVHKKESPRGPRYLQNLVLFFVNLGLIMRCIAEPVMYYNASIVWRLLLITAAWLQWLGVLSFLILIWPRLHPRKRRNDHAST